MRIWEFEPRTELYRYLLPKHSQKEIERFCALFCPPGLRPQFGFSEAAVLLAYVAEGLFSFDLSPGSEVRETPVGLSSAVGVRNSAETKEHLLLKALSTQWLCERGISEVDYEGGYEAGEFDVAARDRSWIVECGASRPSKVYQFLPNSPTSKFVVFNRVGIAVFRVGTPALVEEYIRLKGEQYTAMLNNFPVIG
jgi:hypothetical protein